MDNDWLYPSSFWAADAYERPEELFNWALDILRHFGHECKSVADVEKLDRDSLWTGGRMIELAAYDLARAASKPTPTSTNVHAAFDFGLLVGATMGLSDILDKQKVEKGVIKKNKGKRKSKASHFENLKETKWAMVMLRIGVFESRKEVYEYLEITRDALQKRLRDPRYREIKVDDV